MLAEVKISNANGIFMAPPSKSMAHRMLICAALSNGVSTIKNVSYSEDIKATIDSLTSLGAKFELSEDFVTVKGIDINLAECLNGANCRESGSTLRFLIPIFLLTNKECKLFGSEFLFSRPLKIYEEIATEQGIYFNKSNDSIVLKGKLKCGEYIIPGDVSSQFISGLLFALPLLENDSKIKILGKFESKSYVDLTISALKIFGVSINFVSENEIFIKGNQQYSPSNVYVEGDYSNASFFEALNYLGSDISLEGLSSESLQGDKIYIDYFKQIKEGTPTLNIENCPDLAPILFVMACYFNGATFIGTRRLKMKESDRANVMKEELQKFGAEIDVLENEVIIKKSALYKPNEVLNGHNDHRIVMSLTVLLTKFGGKIAEANAVKKSFPDFFQKIKELGIYLELKND